MDDKAISEQAYLHACAREAEQVTFLLQDGNFIVGYHYRANHEGPLVVLLHGASDSHTVFDFASGFRIANDLARQGLRGHCCIKAKGVFTMPRSVNEHPLRSLGNCDKPNT
jgi:hypothetical protein